MNFKNFQQKIYAFKDEISAEYGKGNKNDSSIKFEAKVIKWSLCNYLDAYVFVAGDMTATGCNADSKVAFENCAPFTRCIIHINDENIDTAENYDTTAPM